MILYLTRPIFSKYNFSPPEEVMYSWKIDYIFSAMARKKATAPNAYPFYHNPLLIAVLKIKTKLKSIKF